APWLRRLSHPGHSPEWRWRRVRRSLSSMRSISIVSVLTFAGFNKRVAALAATAQFADEFFVYWLEHNPILIPANAQPSAIFKSKVLAQIVGDNNRTGGTDESSPELGFYRRGMERSAGILRLWS